MPSARAIDEVAIWTLSIVLAAIFLLAGVPKLLGVDVIGLQAATMRGFPEWIRIAVGIVEVVCAVGLLVRPVATAAAVALALVTFPATVTQYLSGQPGVFVPPLLTAALIFVAWRRSAPAVSTSYHEFADVPHPLLREGVIAGLIGATVIAVWFFVIDLIAGRPLFTPAALGRALLSVLGASPPSGGTVTFVFVYTVFHYAAFMVGGLLTALVVVAARREPSILFGFLILFVMTEIGIYGIVALLEVASALGRYAWVQIMAGSALAALAMGAYFWRAHHELADEFRHSLDWESPPDREEASLPLPSAAPDGRRPV